MEHQKILNLLNEANDSKFVIRKENIINDQSNPNYDRGNEITYNTEVLKSNIFDYNDAYILVRSDIVTTAHIIPIQVAFKNFVSFTKCITKMDGTTIDNTEDLDLIMSMYNLMEYSPNYSETTACLWFYLKVEATNFDTDIADNDNFKSFEYKTKLLGNTETD